MIVGDCVEVMRSLEAQSFDLVVTSPPYNADKEYEAELSFDAYVDFAEAWTSAIPRLLKPGGSFWLNVGYTNVGPNEALPLTYVYHPLVAARGMKLIQEIVWHYEGGMAYKRRFTHRTERWQWWALDPRSVKFRLDDVRDCSLNRTEDKRNHPLGKNPTDYWYYDRVTNHSKVKGGHPCPFPERMIERIIRACSDEGDNVLDPFAGSGTVGRVATRLKRRCTLIERERKYFAVSSLLLEAS